jgi:hypothetical protein
MGMPTTKRARFWADQVGGPHAKPSRRAEFESACTTSDPALSALRLRSVLIAVLCYQTIGVLFRDSLRIEAVGQTVLQPFHGYRGKPNVVVRPASGKFEAASADNRGLATISWGLGHVLGDTKVPMHPAIS